MNYALALLLALAVSCRYTPSSPKQALPQEQLQSLYVALLEENERCRSLPPDSIRHFNADSIFSAFNTTEQEFRSTVASYRTDPKIWQRFYEGVIKRLDEKQKQQSAKSKP